MAVGSFNVFSVGGITGRLSLGEVVNIEYSNYIRTWPLARTARVATFDIESLLEVNCNK